MWGVSYYFIGIFGPAMGRELQWSQSLIYGGFSVALLAMSVVSPLAGRAIDQHGGSRIMAAGSALVAAACCGLAFVSSVPLYYACWGLMGVAMRLTLYDAAFATLARRGGLESRRAMSQVTLFGGLASTVFWPIGNALEAQLGWRGAALIYGAIALAMAALLLALPPERPAETTVPRETGPMAEGIQRRSRWIAASLFALITALLAFLNSAMSSHMIVMLSGLGIAAGSAVWISSLRGIGQTFGRLCEIAFGKRLHPLRLNVLATALIPAGFLSLALGGAEIATALLFVALYGIGNGVATITRGSLPLVLFGTAGYGATVGKLLVPSYVLSAAAPLVYAEVAARFGSQSIVILSLLVATCAFAASLVLVFVTRRHIAPT